MKTIAGHMMAIICLLAVHAASGQTIYTYPLSSGFSSNQAGGPDLIQIPNNSGLTGEFTTRTVPVSTCGQGGTAGGYFFEDDAGLQFNDPEGFIDQSYSLAMNFQVDELIYPPSWVRILSFTHIDDIGVYIYLTNPPYSGTLEFWPYGTVGEDDFFNPNDFYQLILVRNNTGLIKIYINGEEFAQYDDSETQKFVPAPPNNFIVFFRDDPSVLANEASPGFVSNIIIRNMAWSADEVQDVWENFCSSLLDVEEQPEETFSVYPNPATSGMINIQVPEQDKGMEFRIFDGSGRLMDRGLFKAGNNLVDISHYCAGLYLMNVITPDGVINRRIIIDR